MSPWSLSSSLAGFPALRPSLLSAGLAAPPLARHSWEPSSRLFLLEGHPGSGHCHPPAHDSRCPPSPFCLVLLASLPGRGGNGVCFFAEGSIALTCTSRTSPRPLPRLTPHSAVAALTPPLLTPAPLIRLRANAPPFPTGLESIPLHPHAHGCPFLSQSPA